LRANLRVLQAKKELLQARAETEKAKGLTPERAQII
jgi:hypothetical protein